MALADRPPSCINEQLLLSSAINVTTKVDDGLVLPQAFT